MLGLATRRIQAVRHGGPSIVKRRAGSMNWVKSKDHGQSDEEFKLEALERMASTNLPKDFDPKSQRIDLLDLRIPLPISRAAPGIKGKLDWAYNIVLDKIKNILSFRKAYKVGLLSKPSFSDYFKLTTAPFTSRALSAYTKMNACMAQKDLKSLAQVCSEEQFDRARRHIRGRAKDQNVVWKVDEHNQSVEVLSFRAADVWSTHKPEDFCAQALVRFDSRQSVAVYQHSGKLLSGDPKKMTRVREYIVMERKGWTGGDWMLRKPIHLK
ncbi:Tim44 domain containing protein [Ceratobasidium theobromae]|uniref:Large ribosomal subunit protein mL45 n=1 Tax=Ceratobasidium theobromae TaxID=1582974 RepID=A0A5N5QSB7_9AGAM|nr:Tim44 domain containing protein [Ceratobasidium theobromae]